MRQRCKRRQSHREPHSEDTHRCLGFRAGGAQPAASKNQVSAKPLAPAPRGGDGEWLPPRATLSATPSRPGLGSLAARAESEAPRQRGQRWAEPAAAELRGQVSPESCGSPAGRMSRAFLPKPDQAVSGARSSQPAPQSSLDTLNVPAVTAQGFAETSGRATHSHFPLPPPGSAPLGPPEAARWKLCAALAAGSSRDAPAPQPHRAASGCASCSRRLAFSTGRQGARLLLSRPRPSPG